MLFVVGVSCRIRYSIVSYLYVSCSESITSVWEEGYRLLIIMWFLFGKVFCSSGCLGWAALFYCGTPWDFHMIILYSHKISVYLHRRVNVMSRKTTTQTK